MTYDRNDNIRNFLKHWDFILIDILVLFVSFVLSYWLRHGISDLAASDTFRFQAMTLLFCHLIVCLFSHNYYGILRRKRFDELLAVCRFITETFLLAIISMFLTHRSQAASRLQFAGTFIIYIILDFLLRQFNKRRLKKSCTDESRKKRLVLFTTAALAEQAQGKLYQSDTWRDFTLIRIILIDEVPQPVKMQTEVPASQLNEAVLREISHDWVDEVFILQADNMTFPTKLMSTLLMMGFTVHYSVQAVQNDKWENPEMGNLGGYWVITNRVKFISPGQMLIKRIFDLIAAVIGCIVTGILSLIIGPLIYRADPGPIFFGQTRVGENGHRFKVYKFRSMYMDAETRKTELYDRNQIRDGMMFKIEDDPRIIGSEKKKKDGSPGGIGNFIRNTSIDEFPQFFNVLRGDMSIVGWRPCTLDEWEKYELKHRIRASMKPGITGMWQVSGRSTITNFEEVVRLDRQYIENWSIALDVKIMLKTIAAVIQRKGAR